MTTGEGPHVEHDVTSAHAELTPTESQPTAERPISASPPMATTQVQTTSSSRFAPDAMLAAAIGVVLVVIGLIVTIRGGFSGPMSTPVVTVVGFMHTTILGMVEIGVGVCLLIAGATQSRNGALFVGGLLGVAGFVGAVQASTFDESLALEPTMGWLAVAIGGVVVLAALLLPRYSNRSSTIHQDLSQR